MGLFVSVMDDKWDLLITEFRRFGGIADNICIKEGEYGRGVFPANPSLRARIFTPSKLFIKQDDIYLEDDHLRIKKDKVYDQEIKNFFIFIKIIFHGDLVEKKQQNYLRKD